MALTRYATSIFIMANDPNIGISQKYFLDSHNLSVKVVSSDSVFETHMMRREDIVLFDMGNGVNADYIYLNMFVNMPNRPKLLVTTMKNQAFKESDMLIGGASKVLLKPFVPGELLEAITSLADMPNSVPEALI